MKKERHSRTEKQHRAGVFISESCPLVAFALESVINGHNGCHVCGQTHDPTELHSQLRQLKPNLLITDFDPEHGKGFNAIKSLREEFPNLPILVFSRWNELVFAERIIRLGAQGYVPQRASISTLTQAFNHVLNDETYMSSVVKENILGRLDINSRSEKEPDLEQLNNRELEVLCLMGRGKDPKGIAQTLGLRVKTVETYRSNIMKSLGISGINHLLVWSVGRAPRLLE